MSAVVVLAVTGIAAGAAGVAALVVPPTKRLAPRVRPYAVVARSALGHRDATVAVRPAKHPTGVLPRLFGPPLLAVVARFGRSLEQRGDDQLLRLLRQSGAVEQTPDEYRVRQLGEAIALGVLSGVAVAVLIRTPVAALLGGVAGFVVGATRSRRRLEREVAARAAQIRLELYTINHLLAMDVRTGAGPMQAVQRLVDRGHGAAVNELRDVLAWIRSGMGEAPAFRRAAELSPEPSASRTYQLLAAGIERGVDLAGGLLALSEDIRDSRREQLHKEAVRRRAAMLLPTIGILAPIMLLFIVAPLPSIVLGHR
jgi:Flp pilus assembly protein TadB